YSQARHHAICALRVATSKCPFASQDDPLYRMEIELLRPGTMVPSSDNVAHDVRKLYAGFAPYVQQYF
ncbi:hypothetical protein C8J56DRAFT_720457, partial [Mycena floridula]